MQGFVHLLLEAYVSETIGPQHLRQIRQRAGIEGPPLAAHHYPDQVTTQLLQAISEYESVALDDVLYQFGVYFMNAPLMHQQYRVYLEGHTSARSLLDYVPMIHRHLGAALQNASLPDLHYIDHSADLREIIYDSPRGLCRFLQGVVAGVGQHFNETLEIREMECQHRGAPACRILVRFVAASPAGARAGRSQSGAGASQPFSITEATADQEDRRQREEQADMLILHTLATNRTTRSRPLMPGSTPETPLSLALSLFEIARLLTAQSASAEYTRLSLIQRSLTRLAVQGFIESKVDPQTIRQNASAGPAALSGQGILAAQRYRITPAGQAWLLDMQHRQVY